MAALHTGKREIWGLITLFGLFLAATFYYEKVDQEIAPVTEPSSLIAQGPGVKALYNLYERLGYRTERLQTPWNSLSSEQGLLLVTYPQSRPATQDEIAPLRRWVDQGGTILFLASGPAQPFDPKDTVAGDLALVPGPKLRRTISPADPNSPYLHNLRQISFESPLRINLATNAPYTPLFRDSDGLIGVIKPLGKGAVLVVADDRLASNSGIQENDNVLFLANVAAVALRNTQQTIAFDEYHHGVGFAAGKASSDEGLLAYTPLPVRLALFHLLALAGLLIYNGNRRYGPARTLPTPTFRPSTDYVGSMARLYRRAGAADLAITGLYLNLARELRRKMDLAPDAPLPLIAQRAQRNYRIDGAELLQTLERCDAIQHGQRIPESEMLSLARRLEHFREDFEFV